jgi:hypothetical protein
VSLGEIVARLWRHAFAVLAILIVAMGLAYSFKHTPPTYDESATLVFLPPASGAHPNPLSAVGGALTEAAGVVAIQAMSAQGQAAVRQAGGTAQIDVELLNSYNLEYPNYSNPYLSVSTTSQDFPAVHRTFTVLTRLLTNQFIAQQVRDNVSPVNRIAVMEVGDTGPLLSQGSSKRALGALVILTIVAVFAVTSFLDRHPVRLGRLVGMRTPGWPPSQIRVPRVRAPDPDPAGRDY